MVQGLSSSDEACPPAELISNGQVDSDTTVEEVNSDDVVKSGMKVTKKAYACTTSLWRSSRGSAIWTDL